jgi:anthranilate synthase component 1
MNALTVVSTDLLTPLGAYLRLRQRGRASFLLESVERGRLGRHSFVGSGSRLVDIDEAEACGLPVVGYLGYDHAAVLEPTVPLPDAGRGLPESRFVVAETLVRFDHGLGMAEVLAGDPNEVADLLDGPLPETPRGAGAAGSTRRLPSRHQYERAVVQAKKHIRAGDAFQIVLSQRARPLPLAAQGEPVAVPLPARARRPRPRGLLAGDARQGGGTLCLAEPDCGHDPPR